MKTETTISVEKIRGEAKKRLKKDPNRGKGFGKKEKTSNTKGLFHVADTDGEHFLVVYMPLRKGFKLPSEVDSSEVFWDNELKMMSKSLTVDRPRGIAFCYIEKHPDLRIGDNLYGELEENLKSASLQGRFTRFKTIQVLSRRVG